MILKRLFKLIWISALIALLINFIDFVVKNELSPWEQEWEEFVINFIFSMVITAVNTTYFNYLGKWYSWTDNGLKRILLSAVGTVILTMITLFVVLFSIRVFYFGQPVAEFFEQQKIEWYLFGFTFTMIMSVVFHAFYFYKELQNNKFKEQKVIARSATAQFDALKNQLDPHFLFNSLNVLVSLIEENPKAATKFTTSLSKVYRYVLEQRNKELVSVDEELAFARTYVGLLKTRFEDSLQIDIPERSLQPDAKVVPLSLQLLLENAVKHNVVSDTKPLKLRIYEDGNHLVVENNLQKKQTTNSGSGVGLQNIVSRYQLLTDKQMSISETDHHFQVNLPMLSKAEKSASLSMDEPIAVKDVKRIKVEARVADIKKFYDDVVKTIVISALLALVNWFTSDFPWAIFPALGMSIGLFFQYLKTFNNTFFLGKGWEERKIEQYINDKNLYMTPQESYQDRYKRAKDKVEKIRSFYTHLLIYIMVNLGIASLNYYQNQWEEMWFLFTTAGWGIGLLAHGFSVFGRNPFTGKNWEERKIKELMEKEN